MLVIAKKCGQLGNRLCLFSHIIACARENNLQLVNIAFDDYAHLFQSTCDVAFPSYPPSGSTHGAWKWSRSALYRAVKTLTDAAAAVRCSEFPVKIIRLKGEVPLDLGSEEFLQVARRRKWVFMKGWCFRDYSAVKRHADAIRDYFQPIAEHLENVAKVVAAARADANVLVGVHIRHGDYAKHLNGKYFYTVSQYVHGMRAMARLLEPRKVRFLVCSNVPQDESSFGDLKVTMGPGHLVEDMYAFARCDYLIGPPSTYTIWASFYGKVPLHAMEEPEGPFDLESFEIVETL
jgi:hypothetical protein